MKPTKEQFEEAAKAARGHIGKVADKFGVLRATVHNWMSNDPELRNIILHYRGRMLDECVEVGRVVALGIPDKDEDGNFIGWKERPDPSMLRYFMGVYGKREGYGENLDITSNGETINSHAITPAEAAEFIKELKIKLNGDA